MHKKLLAQLLATVILVTVLSACVMPASQAPKATVASSTEIPFPITTQPGIFSGILGGTQTAVALNGTPVAETSTSVPIVQTTPLTTAKPKATTKPTKTPKPNVVESIPTATEPTEVQPSPTAPERPATYILQHGEYLICIARRFNVDLNDLFNENGMNMYSRPYVGTVLQIPQNDSWNTAYGPRMWHAHPTQYTVKSGDNIYTIACHFGDVYPEAILSVNNLQGAYTLSTGQVINIP